MMLKIISVSAAFFILTAICCNKKDAGTPDTGNNNTPPGFAKGADISWITEMETAGRKFYTSTGSEKDCLQILKDLGMNTIRLRVWVNPADGWCNTTDLVTKAVRVKNAGMKIMINFHYSDVWADPGHQTKPAAWSGQDFTTLKQSLSTHTTAVLNALKTGGVTPDWVQVGNETNDGMLWPDGRASVNMSNFSQLINAGYDAVKSVFPSAKVIVHISNGWDNNLFRWIFDGLTTSAARFDVIGMSLYPTPANWSLLSEQCRANMVDMVSRYGREVMLVETGMGWIYQDECYQFLSDLISKVKSVPGGKGLGVLYWEPEAYGNWKGYSLGAFDNSGKPTVALNAFK